MAIPGRVSSITVPNTVMYNGVVDVSWASVIGASGYILYVRDLNGTFNQIYSGSGVEFSLNIKDYPDYSKLIFRVYAKNASGTSRYPCESKEVTVIDIEIEELTNGTVKLQPFGLIINMLSSKFDDVPSVRETSETIAGLDGEIPVDMKYSPRLFDLSTFMNGCFDSLSGREDYIKNMAAHISRSVKKLRYLLFRNKIYGVKRISSEFRRFPLWVNLDISFKAYDVYGYGEGENILNGNGLAENGGEEVCCPVIILEGEYNNPTITVNGTDYQIALDTNIGDIITIDCEKETVKLERGGVESYLAGALYISYPALKPGENTISGCSRVKWRNKYLTL